MVDDAGYGAIEQTSLQKLESAIVNAVKSDQESVSSTVVWKSFLLIQFAFCTIMYIYFLFWKFNTTHLELWVLILLTPQSRDQLIHP